MNTHDPLGYGTHVILDGFRADAARLADAGAVESALKSVASMMEVPGAAAAVLVRPAADAPGGISAVLVGAESHVCLHTFDALHKLSLEAFSTRALPVQAITDRFVEGFAVGRYECHVHGRCRLLPRAAAALERVLDGDRQYARVRLRDVLGH